MNDTTPEKSTNQLAVWRDLLDALDQVDEAWQRTQPTGPDTPITAQLPGNMVGALVKAAERGTRALAGLAGILAAQHDTGGAFPEVANTLRQAVDRWPTNR
jgi:hypothetical protein